MVKVGGGKVRRATFENDKQIAVIAGPCQIETLDHALFMAKALSDICSKMSIDFVYKSSYDKANRTRHDSPRGVGLDDGLSILRAVRDKIGCAVLTDVHTEAECRAAAEVVDVLQIPAFLCRQTDLLTAAGETGKPVNIKKGQFLSPADMGNVVEKITSTGNPDAMVCERGTTFGYNNLVVDFRSLSIMRKATNKPVIFDGTHSVQLPGGLGQASGGQREHVMSLTRAAVAVGVAGVFLEVHQDPDNAPSDGPCMVPLDNFEYLLTNVARIDRMVKYWTDR